jgi:hypothetical protein
MIILSTHAVRYKRYPDWVYVDGIPQSGLDLLMEDGSLWFHPYDGSDPRKIQ